MLALYRQSIRRLKSQISPSGRSADKIWPIRSYSYALFASSELKNSCSHYYSAVMAQTSLWSLVSKLWLLPSRLLQSWYYGNRSGRVLTMLLSANTGVSFFPMRNRDCCGALQVEIWRTADRWSSLRGDLLNLVTKHIYWHMKVEPKSVFWYTEISPLWESNKDPAVMMMWNTNDSVLLLLQHGSFLAMTYTTLPGV